MLEHLTNDYLKAIIESDYYIWKGEDNGDNTEKYQARKAEQFAICLILVSREMRFGKEIMEKRLAEKVFFDILRYYDASMIFGESGCDSFLIDLLLGQWKNKFQNRNLNDSLKLPVDNTDDGKHFNAALGVITKRNQAGKPD